MIQIPAMDISHVLSFYKKGGYLYLGSHATLQACTLILPIMMNQSL